MNKAKVASILAWSLGVSLLTSKNIIYKKSNSGSGSGKTWIIDESNIINVVTKTAYLTFGTYVVLESLNNLSTKIDLLSAKISKVSCYDPSALDIIYY